MSYININHKPVISIVINKIQLQTKLSNWLTAIIMVFKTIYCVFANLKYINKKLAISKCFSKIWNYPFIFLLSNKKVYLLFNVLLYFSIPFSIFFHGIGLSKVCHCCDRWNLLIGSINVNQYFFSWFALYFFWKLYFLKVRKTYNTNFFNIFLWWLNI